VIATGPWGRYSCALPNDLESCVQTSYENSLAEHWAVVVAIRKRSPDEAERAMRVILAGAARDLAPVFAGARLTRTKERPPRRRKRSRTASSRS